MPLIVSCVSTFLLIAYSTVMTVAVPAMGADLGVGFGPLQWAVDIYTVILAALLIPAGSLSDRTDRGTLLAAGLVVFAVASLLCALATGIPVLVAGRCLQGIGAALMFATTLPLLATSYDGMMRRRAFSVWGAVSGLASAAGNVIGGFLSAVAWRGIFIVAVPVALTAASLAVRHLRGGSPGPQPSVDGWGMVLLSVVLGDAVVSLLLVADGAPARQVGPAVAVLVVSSVLLVVRERRVAEPLFPSTLLASRVFRSAVLVAAVYYFAAFGPLPLLSQWLQEGKGQSVIATSLILSVQPVVFFLVSAVGGTRLAAVPRKVPFTVGLVLCGTGCAALLPAAGVPVWAALVPTLVLTGVGSGMISPVLPAAAMQGLPDEQTGVASTSVNAARQLGISLGVAACALLLRVTGGGGDAWGAALGSAGTVCALACVVAAVGVRWLLPGHPTTWSPRDAPATGASGSGPASPSAPAHKDRPRNSPGHR